MTEELTVAQVVQRSYETAEKKGWWTKSTDIFPVKIALMHSELGEALADYRDGGYPLQKVLYKYPDGGWSESPTRDTIDGVFKGKPFGVAIELADLIIRVGDTCGRYQIPLVEAIRVKLDYNESRPYRHGGKLI